MRSSLENSRATPGANGPDGPPGLPGPTGPTGPLRVSTSSQGELPDLLPIEDLNSIARATFVYLGISTTGAPSNPLRLWPKMLRRQDVGEAHGQQYSAELQDVLTQTEERVIKI